MPISGPTSNPGTGTAGSAAQLPTGTVTFVMTDIEGSTRLLQHLGGRYANVLAEHRRLLRASFAEHRGCEVSTEGDGSWSPFLKRAMR
jgi:class 3 adenylate cyclase